MTIHFTPALMMVNRTLRYLLLAMLLFLTTQDITAQSYLNNNTVSAPLSAGNYYHNSAINLKPGFSFTATSGNSLRLFIIPTDCVPLSASLSTDQNYITIVAPRIPGFFTSDQLNGLGTCQAMQSVQYFDALGRPLQTVLVKGNPSATKDLIQPQGYDAYGRESIKYLPYTTSFGNSGSYRSNAIATGSGVYDFYNPTGSGASGAQQGNGVAVIPNPFAMSAIEPSPLNRIVEEAAPGDPWQLTGTTNSSGVASGHTVKAAYVTNDAASISLGHFYAKRFSAAHPTITYDGHTFGLIPTPLVDSGFYNMKQLYITVTKDENWTSGQTYPQLGTTEEYQDKIGRKVLKRTFNFNTVSNNLEVLSTYYVYDNSGNLVFVLPPGANPDAGSISQATLDNLCYQYVYDALNRLIRKKSPGKGTELLVYNKQDKPIATQDSVQRVSNQWIITKYDALGRVIMTGVWNNTNTAVSRDTLEKRVYDGAQFDTRDYGSTTTGYNIISYPSVLNDILTINYFDDYNIPNLPPAYDQHGSYSAMTRSLTTASKTAILKSDGTVSSDMLWNVHYYDDRGQQVKSFDQHYFGGMLSVHNFDETSVTFDFSNSPTKSTRKHYTKDGSNTAAILAITLTDSLVYDHLNNRVQAWNKVNGNSYVLLNKNEYNEIGQLLKKHLHSTNGSNFLQDITYSYNERGWLLKSSSNLFEDQLQYNSVGNISGILPIAQYNGNIASQSWGTAATPNSTSYTYSYDNLNRLTEGKGTDGNTERNIHYDLMGNIKTLSRLTAGALTDSLTYSYVNSNNSNRVNTITDLSGNGRGMQSGTTTYNSYDGNGNATYDGRNGSAVSYNMFGLPRSIATQGISYIYDARGQKLRRLIGSTATEYINGIQYAGSSIDFVQMEDGRILNLTGTPNYEYALTDHLGNTRATFESSTFASAPKQQSDYYPFGLEIPKGSIPSSKNNYLYNSKDLQEGLGQYDYGARFYDPVIGRFTTADPLAFSNNSETQYNYAGNSPTSFIDAGGMFKLPKDFAKYPALSRMIIYYLSELKYNSMIKKSFLILGLTGKEYDEMVTNGSGPTIVITRPDEAAMDNRALYGEASTFDKNAPNIIYISGRKVHALELALRSALATHNVKELRYLMFKVSVTILHENAHRVTFLKNKDHELAEDGEDQGAVWERRTFKKQFSYAGNTGQIWDNAFDDNIGRQFFNGATSSQLYGLTMMGPGHLDRRIMTSLIKSVNTLSPDYTPPPPPKPADNPVVY